MSKAIQTRDFLTALRKLARSGGHGRKAALEARAAVQEAGSDGSITVVPRTKHGEDRLPKIEKYDLRGYHRMVVQLIDGVEKVRVFMFVGSHEESEEWLERNRGRRWVRGANDGTVKFVQVCAADASPPPASLEVATEDDDRPLLRFVEQATWDSLGVTGELLSFVTAVTQLQWQEDPDAQLKCVGNLGGDSGLFMDLLLHAEERDHEGLRRRIELAHGEAVIVEPEELAPLLELPENSDEFIENSDLSALPDVIADWAEWMIHLPQEQRSLVEKNFSGTARLRGVSGSGKTCVMVHRAQYLARKYPDSDVVLVTLTQSMRRLLEQLVDQLCGVERSQIRAVTMNQVATTAVGVLHPAGRAVSRALDRNAERELEVRLIEYVRSLPETGASSMGALDEASFKVFLKDELDYVRGRLLPSQYATYLDTKSFVRRGRGSALRAPARAVCLKAIQWWDAALRREGASDAVGLVQLAVALARPDVTTLMQAYDWGADGIQILTQNLQQQDAQPTFGRCLLVDEVQDLSQLEVDLLGALPVGNDKRTGNSEDGLFLVGDGAQTVYKKGFSLKDAQIHVANRSFVLRRNYRNTRDILEAAHSLVETYQFADVDEESMAPPTKPEYCSRRGSRPWLVVADTFDEQLQYLVHQIVVLRRQAKEDGRAGPTIAVIAFRRKDREAVHESLRQVSIATAELKDNISLDSSFVKVSTVESAKGHEFEVVFIVNAVEGVIPTQVAVIEEELYREAARLYVAMTRARDQLFLTCSSGDDQPSRFTRYLEAKCDQFRVRDGHLSQLTPERGRPIPLQLGQPEEVEDDTSATDGRVGELHRAPSGRPILFGKYEIQEDLPSGAMAEAYRVREIGSEVDLFLKLVPLGRIRDLKALEREISHYARLQRAETESVINVIGVEHDDRAHALVTEFADGGTLYDWVPTTGLERPDAIDAALQTARGVARLHELSIVHRDLKPENVLRIGSAWKLADFGIAKDLARHSQQTFQLMGTAGYAAPEQMRGVPADPSADVYSLGKLLVFVLTGQTDIDKLLDMECRSLAAKCTQPTPADRPSIPQVLTELAALVR